MRVNLDEEAQKLIADFRAGKINSSYFLFKLNKEKVFVADDGTNNKISTWKDFVNIFTPHPAAWVIYQYPYTNTEGVNKTTLIMIQWIGNGATPVEKMEYATWMNVIKVTCEIKCVIQAHGESELDEGDVREKVSRFVSDLKA